MPRRCQADNRWLEDELVVRLKKRREEYFWSHCFEHGAPQSHGTPENGWSQEGLGKRLRVSKVTICHWENGDTYPTTSMFLKWCDVLGFDMAELVKEITHGRPQ